MRLFAAEATVGLRLRALVALSAFLLFAAELMVARRLLPDFGSSAHVWLTCLVYYQAVLFLGYLAASRAPLGSRHFRLLHALAVLLPMGAFPFRFLRLDAHPVLGVMAALSASVGAPLLALCATSVLAQRWLAASGLPSAKDPYFLYGSSNLGSLAALVAYPLLIEPAMGLRAQLFAWYLGYGAFALLSIASSRRAEPAGPPEHAPARARLSWLLFAAGGTALLTASTSVVTADAPAPLLWALPLAIYLASFVLCFSPRPLAWPTVRALTIGAIATAGAMLPLGKLVPGWLQLSTIALHSSALFAGCLVCQWNLARSRPEDTRLMGSYYLHLSLGGWLGTALLGLAAPLALGSLALPHADYALAGAVLLAALLLRDLRRLAAWASSRRARAAGGALLALSTLTGLGLASAWAIRRRVDGVRTFYGFHQVKDEGGLRWLHHGNTVHGLESLDPSERGEPLAYYHRSSPIGRALLAQPAGRAAVVGLGVGSLAAYSRPGERWDFYELDPEVERLARQHFTFLSRAEGAVEVHHGDARLRLAEAPAASYRLIVVDAFSSDFVPTHLLTREAMELYLSKLSSGGVVAFHLSNRWFELSPVVARTALSKGLAVARGSGEAPDLAAQERGLFPSIWLAASPGEAALSPWVERAGWSWLPPRGGAQPAWTDDRLNLLEALRPPGR
ncbi:MAG: fused MFS/spermidine synthase [Myxococcales bacterium]|nr:fused MFS/spermidine synthase [Myxococcales bacterium]